MIGKKISLLLEELVTSRLGFFDCIHPNFWCSGLVVITTPLLHSAKLNFGSAQVENLLTGVGARISDNGWK